MPKMKFIASTIKGLEFITEKETNGKKIISTKVLFENKKELRSAEYSYEVLNFQMFSAPVLNRYEPVMEIGSTQSAQIIRTAGEFADTFWVSSPSILYPQKAYQIDTDYTVFMMKPEPKKFISEVTVYQKEGTPFDTILEVNKPFVVSGWKIYQTSYNESMGKWSTQSIVELVKDPWLSIVYSGFFLMIAGTIYIIWTGKRKEDK